MPSDSTLLTALERLMSLYEARSAEAFFHFLWGICYDMISFLLLHILIPTCLNCLLNLKHCCVEVLLLSTVFCSLQMCSEVIKFHNQPAHSSVFISSNWILAWHSLLLYKTPVLYILCTSVYLHVHCLIASLYFVDLSLYCHFIRSRDMMHAAVNIFWSLSISFSLRYSNFYRPKKSMQSRFSFCWSFSQLNMTLMLRKNKLKD